MKVSRVISDGKAVEYRHENNAIFIKLPVPSRTNRREKFMETVQADKKSNIFLINVNAEPEKLMLDPDMWILMDADFRKAE